MTHLKPYHLELVVRALPEPVRDLLQSKRVYLAGGFIRHHVAREQGKTDIDLFGLDFGAANEVAVNMALTYANDRGVGMDVYDTPNAMGHAGSIARLPPPPNQGLVPQPRISTRTVTEFYR